MFRLVGLVVSIGLADSLNPSTIAPALYLATGEHPRTRVTEFTFGVFVVYFVACTASFLIPSAVGENVARLRYAAVPVCVLLLSLRRWRPLPVCLGALALAVSWNVTPIAFQYLKGRADPAAKPPSLTACPREGNTGRPIVGIARKGIDRIFILAM